MQTYAISLWIFILRMKERPWYTKSLWDMCHNTILRENMANFAFPLRKQRNNKDKSLSPKVGAIPISLFSQLLSSLHHNLLLLCNHQAHSNLLSQSLITMTMEEHLTHAISLMLSWKMANWFFLEFPIARP